MIYLRGTSQRCSRKREAPLCRQATAVARKNAGRGHDLVIPVKTHRSALGQQRSPSGRMQQDNKRDYGQAGL